MNSEKAPETEPVVINPDPERNRQTDIDKLLKNVQGLDILKLDIKNPGKLKVEDDVDFFADMTPDIPKKKSSMEEFQKQLEIKQKVRIPRNILFSFHYASLILYL